MSSHQTNNDCAMEVGLPQRSQSTTADGRAKRRFDWKAMFAKKDTRTARQQPGSGCSSDIELNEEKQRSTTRWSMGMLNDRETEEVPGSVLLLSKVSEYNEPLGLRDAPARRSASSLPQSPRPRSPSSSLRWSGRASQPEKKRTSDGKFVLEPQPDDSLNDPLNWKMWRRDAALFSLGFYCMLGGGMTSLLAAGFNNIAQTYGVAEARVALTTGLYMLGLGVGSVFLSPTAILFGKRPVYLVAAICFILTSIWCALSPSFGSLVAARVFQGVAVSSVECLPSATVAEIYFLHEKAYRLGIYTLLLLGGKNLVPLVSAAIIESLGWRWVFYIVAIIVGFGLALLFFFVPETFWDRSPTPHHHRPRPSRMLSAASAKHVWKSLSHPTTPKIVKSSGADEKLGDLGSPVRHAHFESDDLDEIESKDVNDSKEGSLAPPQDSPKPEQANIDKPDAASSDADPAAIEANRPGIMSRSSHASSIHCEDLKLMNTYTHHFRSQPPKTFLQQLKPWSGRLSHDNWFKVAIRPFILFAYPSLLWSALVYSLSIGWLIVLSESVTQIYKSRDTYNFTSLQAGLVYISPFIGGILGTVVAGKVSDLIVRWMARKNGGLYEPEFRLVMAIPITVTTVIGLMGYGWSAQVHDAWIVPTLFFGIISFGCSLGSTTSITFAVDSYRQYAGEALVTLNFSKNVLHGMVFSFFFNNWLESEGSRDVFLAIGGIQLGCMLFTIPMYIYGKRARMWTVRKNLMEKF